ncbi:DUF1801 domain-containing protein [Pedobacter psychrodurus]|uniref:DUF1801 domain-containing protein n=1 Tax=Pedobacter psychrodurus TaxID=2530456 RepID=A0A4R0PZW4_9SPHI|nr:DUF1801 domain-containing protein [Pedobacter psychrodurus]TCD26399.1 DUF1801 domain-containing protein [Pedobacter psychrodurus]
MNHTKKVDEFMSKLEHPLKAELEAVRSIIVNANPKIEEDIKWGGPSFFYKEELATFNPRIKNYVALIFHKGELINVKSDFLEQASKGKVYAKFYSMDQATANKELIEKMVNAWIELMDK